ncbi:MAG: gliding motility-associated C-terminal domain-containing protein [Bacteroidetes bacterium]|nr:gliding motility-associated C-terminal domain-containing protein [Bacteroidota bacterium]
MRKIYTLFTFFVLLLLNFTVLRAQVTVSGSAGGNGTYGTLKLAFDALNLQTTQAGNNIVIQITANTVESATAVLYQPSVSSWASLKIYPTVGGLSISGNIAGPIIDLNGADKVTIDGRISASGTTADLTIINTSTSNTSGTSTIRLIESAENNMVKYCNIKGSTTDPTGGVIYFATSTAGNGNDNDTISYCNISSTSNVLRSINAIFSFGSASHDNSADFINNNNIFDFFNPSITSAGINISGNSTAWNINGNSFYESTTFTPSAGVVYYAININNGTNGDNFNITNNFIGGNAPLCAGTLTKSANSNLFYGMYLNLITATGNNIQGNIIKNINWNNSSKADWYAMFINSGKVDIGTLNKNIIGDSVGTGSITVTNAISNGLVYGIYHKGTGTIQNNDIGSINAANTTAANATMLYGIYLYSFGNLNVNNNLIGSLTTSGSFSTSSTATSNAQILTGIFNNGTGNITINNNTIANIANGATGSFNHLTHGINNNNTTSAFTISNNTIRDIKISNANASTDQNSSIIGILAYSPSGSQIVSGNTVYNLTNTNILASGQNMIGLYINCGTATQNTFSNNLISSFLSNSASIFYGIKIQAGANLLSNNIIYIDGNSASTNYGLYENGAAGNNNILYFNTVYLAGSPNSGSANSFALYSNSNLNTRNFRNNIFFNARSNSGSANGTHYAAFFNYNNNASLTLNYNDYFANGIGGVLGYFNLSPVTNLPIVTGNDVNSLNINPSFINAGGTNAIDYMPLVILTGQSATGITTDYFSVNRFMPTMGAIESSNVDVYSSNVYQSTYATLKDAFAAINAGTHQGALTLKIKGSTTETATALLNASGVGSANYTSVYIYPTASGITIGGSLAAPIVDLNGTDHVCFDGRVNATGIIADLIITNADISTAANNSTIRFRESAENNSIKYCNVKGSNKTANSGIIYFSTSAAGNGNDNDTINFCNISSETSGRTLNAIYAEGSSGFVNNNIVISDNNIFNYFNPAMNSAGIYTSSYNSGWIINNNSFFDTSTFSPTATVNYYGIKINSATGNGGNFLVSNNYIGGNSALCNGLLNKAATSSNAFIGIDVAVGNTAASSIQANIIKKVNWLNNATAVSNWTGINIPSGLVTVTGNLIGSVNGIDSLIVTNSTYTTAQPFIIGIASQSSDAVTIQNSTIGALRSANNDNPSPTGIYGIFTSGTGTYNISNNTIGSLTTSNSIYASSTSSGNQQDIFGIYCLNSGTLNISGNTIANLTNATSYPSATNPGRIKGIALVNAGTANVSANTVRDLNNNSPSGLAANDTIAAIIGIQVNNSSAGSGNRSVSANSIYNLSNTNASIGSNVIGFYCDGDNVTTNTFAGNFIYNFSGNSSTVFYGIRNNNGINKIYNNIINLGSNSVNSIYGIWENSPVSSSIDTIYFNTVYIGGTPTTSAASSYALYSNAISGTFNKSIKNNIFYNARSNSGSASGKHYAAYFNYNSVSNLSLNYNDYYAPGSGGWIGHYNSSDIGTLPALISAIGQDANSLNINPNLVNPGSANPGDYRPTAALSGISIVLIPTDYYSVTRSTTAPTMGALETSNVDVYVSNVFQSSYATLKQAFDFINSGAHTGILTVKIKGNTIETAPAVLNASGSGSANYSSVTVIPVGIRTVTGAITAGSPLIDLNGADNVTINGLNNGTDSLILTNTTVSSSAGTSTIRFIADASNDTIMNCTILGACNPTSATAAGIILFSTGTTTGNDKNVISTNSIGNITGFNPTSVITSSGTSGAISNDSITITGNKIYNWYATNGANAINITANSSAWDINNNKFYQTAAQSGLISGSYLKCIYINSGSAYSISNNNIGYANANSSGMFTNTGGRFTGIDINVASNPVSNIQGNTINNINWTTASGANSLGGAIFNGIIVNGGKVNIGNTTSNTIGSSTGVGSSSSGIYITSTTSNAAIVPIYVNSDASCNISNNNIGAIATGGTAAIGYYFYGISIDEGGNHIVNQNNIGNSTYGSVAIGTLGTTTAACYLYGINSLGTGAITIGNTTGTGNIIHNLCNNGFGTGLIYAISNSGAITGLSKINYNAIDSLFFPTTASSSNCYLINNTTAAATDSLYITNNIFGSNAASFTGTSGGSGIFYGIYQIGSPFKTVISNNVFNNMSVKTSGTIGLIWNNYTAPANGIKIIQNNSIINGFNRILATNTASFYCYYDILNSPSTANITISGNNFSKITSNTTGVNSFFGIYNTSSNNPSLNVYNNILDSISFNGTSNINLIYLNGFGGTAGTPNLVYGNRVSNFTSSANALTIYGIYIGPQSLYVNIYNDSVQNITLSGNSTLCGIYGGGTTNLNKFYNNSINNLSNTSNGVIQGIFINSGNTMNIYQNAINSISSLGTVYGIIINGGTTINIYQHKTIGTKNYSLYGLTSGGATAAARGITVIAGTNVNIYKNNIYNISNTSSGSLSGLVSGIILGGGINDSVFNNTIGDLTAPSANVSDAITAIAVNSNTALSNYYLFYNTINLNAISSGAVFGTTGVSHVTSATATTANLTLRNNIIVNTSTPSGGGISAAYRRSSALLANYNATSNNNLFYSGTPGATRPIMFDGTTAFQTLANYKFAVGTRDAASVTENPNWASTTGSAAKYLHINNTILTAIDNGAVNIPTITDDIDNDIRQGNAGYTGLGTSPDMGADEFDLICGGMPGASTILKAIPVICAGSTDSLWLSTIYLLPGISYQWASSPNYGGPYTNLDTNANQPTGVLTVTTYFRCIIKCTNTGDSIITPIDSIIVSPTSHGGLATAVPSMVCFSTSTTITLSAYTGNIQWQSSPDSLVWTNITGQSSPTLSTGNLTTYFYYRAIVTSSPCSPDTSTVAKVTIDPSTVASISYSGTPYCNSLTTPQAVTLTGATGGTYSAAAGLSINATTGAITPSTSTSGTFTVTYTIAAAGICNTVTTTTSVTIVTSPAATISYAGTPYCKTLITAQNITLTGTAGGTYTVSPAGLTINAATGAVTPSTSTSGTYTVTYTIAAAGACPTVTTQTSVTINALPTASISYSGTPYCNSITTPQSVTLTGAAGGTFTSTTGLSINAVNGDITPSTSTAGTYTVTYIIAAAGGCATVTTTSSVTITALPAATISYAGSPYCKTLITAQSVTLTGSAGGTYIASPAGLTINAATGAVIPSTSTAGTYTVTYTIAAAGGCQTVTTTTTVTINALPTASISYAGTPYCNSLTTAQSVTLTGAAGGTFTSTTGLSINTANGDITPSTSTAGTYTVTYIIAAAGGCSTVTTTASVTITALPAATINYAGSPYCKTLITAQSVTLTGSAGGTYTALPAGLTINAATGSVTPSTSTAGTYTVTYTIAAAGGCQTVTTTTTVTVNALPVASISYAGTPFCQTLITAQSVTITGAGGGTFTSTAGLSINTSTGAITPNTSTAGTYTVTYIIAAAGGCATVTTTASVTITALPAATINYAGSPYCKTLTTAQSVTLTGSAGGTYSALPAGLTINAATGGVTPSTSTAGTYTVTYTIAAAGGCQTVTTTTTVTINALPVASISYAGSPFCQTLTTAQSVTITGANGGTFTSTTGLSINTANGDITPNTSTAGTYTVTYIIAAAGGCATVTTTASVTITALPSATISYAGSPYCKTLTTAQSVTLTGTTGGTYSALPAGLTINAATGGVTPSTSTAGTYTVTYTIAATGGCTTVTTTSTVTINALPVASISYAGSPFCQTLTTAQSVTITGASGGTFTSTAGLSINTSTGTITPNTSTAGTYTVTYVIAAAGGCATVTTTASVTITTLPSATISYAGSPYCKTLTTAQSVTLTGTTGGAYSASPAGLTINVATGGVTPSTSTAGTYTVTYTIAATGGCTTVTTTSTVTINALPVASISYAGTPFCQTLTTAQSVTITGASGGTFTSTTGLSINTSTGAITPNTSTAGTYTVTYIIAAAGGCATVTTTTSVTITALPSATISYAGSPYCKTLTTAQSVTLTGTTGGAYSALPAGLTINAATGGVTPSTSTAGTYTVTYTIAATGGCATVTTTTTVTINALPVASISYAGTPFCQTLTTAQSVTITGASGGTFTSTAGLSINTSTGAITPNTSTAGTYTVTYVIAAAGGCATVTTTTSITITALPIASFTYSSDTYCSNVANPLPSYINGGSAGTYSASPVGLSFVSTTTGQINLSASTAGTYTITNTKSALNGCPAVTAFDTITIFAAPTATITYTANPFCKTVTTSQAVTRTGTAGGIYSALPAGLTLDSLTGAVTPSTSTAGTYTVTYTIAAAGGCNTVTITTSVTITTAPTATISYAATPYCQSLTTAQSVTFTGNTGGTYSAVPASLSIIAATGAITPNTSSAGTYTVTYTIAAAGGCATVTATTTVTITASPTATILYAGSPYCKSLTTSQAVTRTGIAGGKYTALPVGLTLDSLTGAVIPSTSTAGTYTVTYTIAAAGGCNTATFTTSVTITAVPIASYTYSANIYCSNGTNPLPSYYGGGSAGTFSATPVGLSFVSTTTGQINLSGSTGGTYIITNTKTASGCPSATAADTITITTAPSATITYAGSPFCRTVTTAQAVTRTGTAGGTYSFTPLGLSINTSTGAITPSTSTAGSYSVTYTMAATGGCNTITTSTTVTITNAPTASINYTTAPYCNSDTNSKAVIRIGTAGGTYTAAPAGLTLNSSTGAIKPSTSTPGTYTVSYTIAAAGGCATVTATKSVTITALPTASISYAGNPFCTSVTTSQSVTLVGNTSGTYSALPVGLTLNTNTGAIIPSTSTPGNYHVTYTIVAAGGCPKVTDSVQVTITLQPILKDSSNAPICEQESLLLYSTFINGATYHWSGPNGWGSPQQNPVVSPFASVLLSGLYTVNVTGIPGGCPDMSASIPIVVNPKPVANFSHTPVYPEMGEDIYLTYTGTTANLWNWYLNGILFSNVEKPVFRLDNYGNSMIYLYVQNTFGCKDTVSKFIYVKELSKIWMPNAFTPDGDGYNDIYMVYAVNPVKKFSMRIFNRWGQMVFETENITEGWDGRYKGEECPIGTYVVVINYTQSQIDQSFELNQSVTLIR